MRFFLSGLFSCLAALFRLEQRGDAANHVVFRKIYSWIKSYCYLWVRMGHTGYPYP